MKTTTAREYLAFLSHDFLNAWLEYVKYVTDNDYHLYNSTSISGVSFIGSGEDETSFEVLEHDLEERFSAVEGIASQSFQLATPQYAYGRHFIVDLGALGGESPTQGTAIFTSLGELLFTDGVDTSILSSDGAASSLKPYNPIPEFLEAMQKLYLA